MMIGGTRWRHSTTQQQRAPRHLDIPSRSLRRSASRDHQREQPKTVSVRRAFAVNSFHLRISARSRVLGGSWRLKRRVGPGRTCRPGQMHPNQVHRAPNRTARDRLPMAPGRVFDCSSTITEPNGGPATSFRIDSVADGTVRPEDPLEPLLPLIDRLDLLSPDPEAIILLRSEALPAVAQPRTVTVVQREAIVSAS